MASSVVATRTAPPSVDRIDIVGASLAGLSAAEILRAEGFAGRMTLVGYEPLLSYDRPPLSKTVLSGWVPAESTTLPQTGDLDAQWLLGVPREDQPRFHVWADTLAHAIDPDPGQERTANQLQAFGELNSCMSGLIAERRAHPTDDLLSGLVVGDEPAGHVDDANLIITMTLLLVAGHETMVNLITNSMLTVLRYSAELERLRDQPEVAPRLVEEVLRYEPPVQFTVRYALADITLAGVTIPQGAGIYVLLAAGNRDPCSFSDPDRALTPAVPTTNIAISLDAPTSVWALPWRAFRRRLRSRRRHIGWSTHAWSPTRPLTDRMPCCAVPATCPSPSTGWRTDCPSRIGHCPVPAGTRIAKRERDDAVTRNQGPNRGAVARGHGGRR
jgi:hypothetical protein